MLNLQKNWQGKVLIFNVVRSQKIWKISFMKSETKILFLSLLNGMQNCLRKNCFFVESLKSKLCNLKANIVTSFFLFSSSFVKLPFPNIKLILLDFLVFFSLKITFQYHLIENSSVYINCSSNQLEIYLKIKLSNFARKLSLFNCH